MQSRYKKINKKNSGYTIVETMIAVSLFLVVITTGINALLNANVVHQKSQDIREVMDNLNFIMEDMSRHLRTGSNVHCLTGADTPLSAPISIPQNCFNNKGWGIAFEHVGGMSGNDNDQWVYYIDDTDNTIRKSTQGLTDFYQLTTDEVKIDSATSGFYVLGAETSDKQQPLVIIKLVGNIFYQGISTPFSLQTSMSQRLLDI